MADPLRKKVLSTFRLNGLSLQSDATKYLRDVLVPLSEPEIEDWLEKIVETVQKQPLSSTLVDREVVETAVQECSRDPSEDSDKAFCIIDAFDVPTFAFNSERKKFFPVSGRSALHPNAEVKSELYKERYTVIQQRTIRHELFSNVGDLEAVKQNQTSDKFDLKTVEYLLGSTGSLGNVIVLGMLTQIKEGKFYLEDPTGAVELDITEVKFHTGLYTENCFVLAEGNYDDEIFHVTAIGFPPAEPSKVTRAQFGNINFFGGPSTSCAKASSKLKEMERENKDAMFVIMSDVHLDQPRVMEKLRTLLTGYSTMPPSLFILCGNFNSQPYGPDQYKILKESLQVFASMVAEFPSLVEQSRFLFIPGPQDPGPGNILPRPPIPESLRQVVTTKIPNATFASNPCRIQYCTQEVVIFREDLTNKMCRNSLHLPSDMKDIPNQLLKTLLAQAHLCPLPLHVRPVYWGYDASLRVYPIPDLLILADKYDPYTCSALDCQSTNPGSFPRSDFMFKVYWPSSKEVEDCKISD
ncbi:predicted protein [Nematostella vectensis]|uniref:DNA polymerase epsilon subunit n=1 Tax=Nematostella vectensis TaxID=45351 RepID=A7S7Y2_NEMVE|nr:DNA polymerase epsilon subunit 2 [Nematostella vectensis]EDO40154.1 predicted protein [Nematostella vectensis]|eukprot:XP_001632217.1 predicted protein [Nematostella vectensis]